MPMAGPNLPGSLQKHCMRRHISPCHVKHVQTYAGRLQRKHIASLLLRAWELAEEMIMQAAASAGLMSVC